MVQGEARWLVLTLPFQFTHVKLPLDAQALEQNAGWAAGRLHLCVQPKLPMSKATAAHSMLNTHREHATYNITCTAALLLLLMMNVRGRYPEDEALEPSEPSGLLTCQHRS